MPQQDIRLGVIGCGRMGKLHARVARDLSRSAAAPQGDAARPGVTLAGVYDVDADHARAVAELYEVPAYSGDSGLAELLKQCGAAIVAVPTSHHLAVARQAMELGVDLLIEKPLAATVGECREIVRLAGERGRIVQVGHVERFNPAVRAMTGLEIRPQFIEVTRVSPLTFRSIDVGVVLDMMIHDIDIVLLLAGGRPIESVEAVGVSVIGQVEDVCNARIRFGALPGEEGGGGGNRGGCTANLTASRLALKTERKLRVFSSDAYVSLDYAKKYGIVARRGQNLDAIRDTVARIRAGEIEDLSQLNYTDLVQVEELQIDDVEPLRAEQESFLQAVRTRTRPVVSAEDGLAAVQLAARIVAAIGGTSL